MKPMSLSKIFTEKIFRIPDYQRGYAWQNHTVNKQLTGQLVDFWEDLINLDLKKTHYTGVLTLEKVPEKIYKEWTEDWWLVNPKGKAHEAFYIVDGQQRLTTIIILIQCILEQVGDEIVLNETSVADIRKKFVYQQKPEGISRTYMFGYESQNPSYEFLKTKIFNEHSATNNNEESLYTYNLEKAKEFFKKQLENYGTDKLEELFIKLTQKMVFNEYVIENDLDVFIAFETMNNRGKPLSNLELLKNRLIYLSTLFPNEDEADKELLRTNINACWKTIYEYLGKNKKKLLPDDVFLKAHWIMYFAYSRIKGDDYIRFLLEQFFTAKNIFQASPLIFIEADEPEIVTFDEDESEEDVVTGEPIKQITVLTLKHINDYVTSMQKAVRHWYDIFNPLENTYKNLSEEEQNWLDKINRIGIGNFAPLILSVYCSDRQKRIELLQTIEKYIFLLFRVSQQRANTGDSEFYKAARELYYKETEIEAVISQLEKRIVDYIDLEKFGKYIKSKFTYYGKDGFYGWSGLRYFLYEHEQYLMEKAEYSGQKVSWATFTNSYKDCVTIEHIYPQTPDEDCWLKAFENFSADEKNIFCNSLGNLLLLSQPKNSSLQNDCFDDKSKNQQVTQGYFNGSYSETRVANKYSVWTSEEIKARSLELIGFMETNWGISFGDEKAKMELLQLGFLLPQAVEITVTE